MGIFDPNIRWFSEIWDEFTQAIDDENLDQIRSIVTKDPGVLHRCCVDLGESPIHEAVRKRSFIVADLLLELGADINANCEPLIGNTPLDIAVNERDVEAAVYLIDRGANPNIPTWMWLCAIDRAVNEAEKERDDQVRKEWVKLYEVMYPAAIRFPAPVYPDGSKPVNWPPVIGETAP